MRNVKAVQSPAPVVRSTRVSMDKWGEAFGLLNALCGKNEIGYRTDGAEDGIDGYESHSVKCRN